MPTVTLQHVSKFYKPTEHRRRGRKFEIGVENVDLTIEQGEFVFVIGSSGSGKSTLLDLISGKAKPSEGLALVDGRETYRAKPMFGCVAQHELLMHKKTVYENLRAAAGRFETPRYVQARIRKVLGLTGMAGCEEKYPADLSGPERRRVELARALINSPPILVLDEITHNLDGDNIWDIFLFLSDINQMGTTVIMATHNSQYVNIMRRRVITLVDGRIFSDVAKGRYGDVV